MLPLPYPPIHPLVNKAEQGLWHSVAAATLGAGHGLGICRGLPFDVESFENVASVIAFECCRSSYHSSQCFFVIICYAKI